MESTPKPAKNARSGVPRWPPMASKCLLLYIRNDQSSYIGWALGAIHRGSLTLILTIILTLTNPNPNPIIDPRWIASSIDRYIEISDFSINDPTAYVICSVCCNVKLHQEFNFGTQYLEKYTPHLFYFLEIGSLNYEL